MAASVSTIDNILKEVWTEQRVAEQLYQENPILDRVKKLKGTTTGQQAQTTIHTGRNEGFSLTSSDGSVALNAAGQQSYAQATWNYKHAHQQVAIDGAAIDQSSGDVNALASVIDEEITGALSDLNRKISMYLQIGSTGYVAQCGTTAGSATIQLNTTDATNAFERGWLDVGTVVDIGTASDEDADVNGEAVSALSTANGTITVTTSSTTNSSDYVTISNTRSGSTSYVINGLPDIVGTSTFAGVNPASYTSWQSPSVDSTSQALSLSLLYQQNQKVHQKTGKTPSYVIAGLKQQRKAYELAQAQVRFAGDGGLNVGNVDGVNVGGVTIHGIPDVKNENIWFLSPEDLFVISAGDPYWQDKVTGGRRLEWRQGYDQYVGKLTFRFNLGCRRRNTHAVLSGLT